MRSKPIAWAAVPLVYIVYFLGLTATGMLGPDEPRYAAIGRAMAQSGDWITPRLWGIPWFEKPALLYWMTAGATKLGFGAELAPRLPVAICSVAFLIFFWWMLNSEFGCRAAWLSTLILATSGMWIGYSQIGVTDIPMTVCFSAAMLLVLKHRSLTVELPEAAPIGDSTRADERTQRSRDRKGAVLLALAVLAKGLGPIVLAAPLLRFGLRRWLHPRFLVPFFAVALPWYALCYARNGQAFLHEFFVVHTFGRFASTALAHGQPGWYYIPVLLAAFLPWTPLFTLLARRKLYSDARRQFLLFWMLWTLVFFSANLNKLPGYILPALPAAAALAGIALDEAPRARAVLAVCALLVGVFPIAAQVLPDAIVSGLSHAPKPRFHPLWLVPVAMAAFAWILEDRGRRLAATFAVAAGAALGVGYLKLAASPDLDERASVRATWRKIEARLNDVCLDDLKRDWVYGLNYYAGRTLPSCDDNPKPIQLTSEEDRLRIWEDAF